LEASEYSDLDLFFLYNSPSPSGNQDSPPQKEADETRRLQEVELFGDIVKLGKQLHFPRFSNGGQYLCTHETAHILRVLGGPEDDSSNAFTLRMLLLLESAVLFGETAYAASINQIIEAYYRDYHNNEGAFRPWFLLNDISRYWNTLKLNYENRRNDPTEANNTPQRVRNFKLKFSRMTTCFATIVAIGSHPDVTAPWLTQLARLTPQERLDQAEKDLPRLNVPLRELRAEYAWFLEMTGLPTDELHSHFSNRDSRSALFRRANRYGDLMFSVLTAIDGENPSDSGLLRALVI
jgi:hypothetical protein